MSSLYLSTHLGYVLRGVTFKNERSFGKAMAPWLSLVAKKWDFFGFPTGVEKYSARLIYL